MILMKKMNIKNKFQKEYELYMKKITDNFIVMNGDNINNNEWYKDTSVFYEVVWNGGIDFSFLDLSKKYLNENSLTYDQWYKKYK